MNMNVNPLVLYFSSLMHGGGKTFAENIIDTLDGTPIMVSTIYDKGFTRDFAKRLGVQASNIYNPKILLNPRAIVFSNSQLCAAIASVLYPARHYYVTHGYANGLPFAPMWRRLAWMTQVNIPGTKIIACGDSEHRAIERMRLSRKHVNLIRNGVPKKINSFSPIISPSQLLSPPNRHIAYIGRVTFQKGLDILLRALELPCMHDRGVKLSIIGNYQESEKQYCESIRKLISSSPAEIEILPPHEIDSEFLSNFSAIVAPSRFEGLPYTILEAAHAGTPIIISDCPGNIDIAPDERFAKLFRSEDENSLASALGSFLDENIQDRLQRVNMLRQRVSIEFSDLKFRDEYLKLLQ